LHTLTTRGIDFELSGNSKSIPKGGELPFPGNPRCMAENSWGSVVEFPGIVFAMTVDSKRSSMGILCGTKIEFIWNFFRTILEHVKHSF
jgi:hypothetical protein